MLQHMVSSSNEELFDFVGKLSHQEFDDDSLVRLMYGERLSTYACIFGLISVLLSCLANYFLNNDRTNSMVFQKHLNAFTSKSIWMPSYQMTLDLGSGLSLDFTNLLARVDKSL